MEHEKDVHGTMVAENGSHDSKSSLEKHSAVARPVTTLVDGTHEVTVLEDVDPTDTLNPQNWSPVRKHLVFAALMSSSILADGAMTWGASLIVPQAFEWGIPITLSATSLNYGILLQGFGGIFAVPLIEAYGRLPIWLWPQLITMCMIIGCCYAPSFESFTAFRSLQGLFGTIPQVIGLPIIHDMYAPKDWPRMINIWGTTFLVGPFLGPALAGYIAEGAGWRGSFKVLAGIYGLSSIMIIAFGRETYYAKNQNTQTTSRVKAFFGIGNTNAPKASTLAFVSKDVLTLIFKLPILLIGIATLVNFTWPIGITVTVDQFIRAPPYLFGNIQAASMRFAGVIGALCGFAFAYFFNEWIFRVRRATWRSEYRLHGVWVPIGCMAAGLVLYGLTLQFARSWVGLGFGWILVNTGMIGSTVAITAFALEKYPTHATAVSAIINMWRTCGGFSVGYFQPAWIAMDGVGVVFGVQAAVVSASIILTITPVIVMARRARSRTVGGA